MSRRKQASATTPGTTPKATPPRVVWQYPDIVKLTAHTPTGQWRKRFKGRDYYFGPLADQDSALSRWRAEWPKILAGMPRNATHHLATAGDVVLLEPACHRFLESKAAALDRGELAWPSYREYRDVTRRIVKTIGKKTPVTAIGPVEFAKLHRTLSGVSPIMRGNTVVKIKTVFRWIEKNLTKTTTDFGTDFRGPPMKSRREQRFARAGRVFTREQIHAMRKIATPVELALIMLGINGGYSNNDAACIETRHVDIKRRRIVHTRQKTGATRRVPLWPETIAALNKVIDKSRSLLLVTDTGLMLVRKDTNEVCEMFADLAKRAKVGGTFRWFRYTFSTIASQTGDDHARDIIMGHVVDGVPENYVLEFPEKRLQRVSDHVHRWLFKS